MSRSATRSAVPNSYGVFAFANPRYVSPTKKPSGLTNRRFTEYQQRKSSSSRIRNSLKKTLDNAHQEALLLANTVKDEIVNSKKSVPIPRQYEGGKWSAKYKRSIDCNNPKGFSQKQHCKYGRKTKKQR
jgi:hypothetical protein